MQRRTLGRTGLDLSLLGFGGFHLVEVSRADAEQLLNTYLDRGGNYIETAAGYGNGASEMKIGEAVSHRRNDYYLATKCQVRDAVGAAELIDRSLSNLQTDHVDVLFIHGVQTYEELDRVLGSGGAIEAAEAATEAGKARFIAISGHGRQDVMRAAIDRYPFDVIMTGFNYFDRFNFPRVYDDLLPSANEKGVGVLAMKPFADGYLFKNWEDALRYTAGLPVACVVTGMNTMELLEKDFRLAESLPEVLDSAEVDRIYRDAPELGRYVCRLCGGCARDGFDPQEVFLLEGLFDRQMDDKTWDDTAQYALRERLKHWFHQNEEARAEYANASTKVDPDTDYSDLNQLCPYGIDIDRKLKIAHSKLSVQRYLY